MNIRIADNSDLDLIRDLDSHISIANLQKCIDDNRVYLVELDKEVIGCLRYGFLFDSYPFLNLIYFNERFRGKGFGTLLMDKWEEDMRKIGYNIIYTSTQADEQAQHFYRKCGYEDVGGFRPPGQEALELILCKRLDNE